ncbi:hypothetical protein [Anaerosolibacter sp.]|uniref:hypothetical protein n=1 Tax=Anaerosolibacter sp. TaxID=1872527 RepID=UPI0039EFF402
MGEFLELYKVIGVIFIAGGMLFSQYRKIHNFEYRIMGFTKTTLKKKILDAIGMGVLGGILGTIVILLLGIKVRLGDFTYLLPVSLLLMMINARYICFAYGGGLLGIMSLALGVPRLDISSLMAIVGVLHLVESVLIWCDGHQHATPIFLENEKYGVIGGFLLQRFWPIPLIVILVMIGVLEGNALPLHLSVMVAALGYSDIALSSTPREKSQKSAIRLLIYSLMLISFSMMARQYIMFRWISVVFALLGHEGLVLWGQREEQKKAPLFRHHHRGITILDVKKDQFGEKIDLYPGDVILRMNNQQMDHKEDIGRILSGLPKGIWMEVMDTGGKYRTIEYKNEYGIHHLGLIIVPKTSSVIFELNLSASFVKRWIERIK